MQVASRYTLPPGKLLASAGKKVVDVMAEPDLLQMIHAKLSAARRRQALQTFLSSLPSCVTVLLLLAMVWHLAEPWWTSFRAQPWLTAGVALVAAVLASFAWAMWHWPGRTAAALAVDHAFDLRERLTTIITLRDDQRASPAGQALLAETRRHVAAIDVKSRFPVQLRARQGLAPLGAGLAVVLASLFAWQPNPSEAVAQKKAEQTQQEIPPLDLEALRKEQEERKERLRNFDSEPLLEMVSEYDKLLHQLGQPLEQKDLQLKVQEITRLNERIQKRQEELAKSSELKRQLRSSPALKNQSEGPAQGLQQALADGNLKKAEEELRQLLEKIEKDALSAQERQQLRKQFKELSRKLSDLAQQKEKLEALAKSNVDPETRQREMQRLKQQMEDLAKLQDMADLLEAIQEELQGENKQEVMAKIKALAKEMLGEELSDAELTELQLLEADLEEIQEGFG